MVIINKSTHIRLPVIQSYIFLGLYQWPFLSFSFLQIKSGHMSWTKYKILSWHSFMCWMCSFSTCNRSCSVVSKSDFILTYNLTRIKSQYLYLYNLAFSAVKTPQPRLGGKKKAHRWEWAVVWALEKCGDLHPART